MSKHVNRNDWLQRALGWLSDEGWQVIRIDVLCKKMQLTKGSFYHHFKNRDAFVEALLEHWVHENTVSVIDQIDNIEDPLARSHALNHMVSTLSVGPERAIRAWGHYDAVVASEVIKVDQVRIHCIADILHQMGAPTEQAILSAKLVYAHFIGYQQLEGLISEKEMAAMTQLLRTALMPQEAMPEDNDD